MVHGPWTKSFLNWFLILLKNQGNVGDSVNSVVLTLVLAPFGVIFVAAVFHLRSPWGTIIYGQLSMIFAKNYIDIAYVTWACMAVATNDLSKASSPPNQFMSKNDKIGSASLLEFLLSRGSTRFSWRRAPKWIVGNTIYGYSLFQVRPIMYF